MKEELKKDNQEFEKDKYVGVFQKVKTSVLLCLMIEK